MSPDTRSWLQTLEQLGEQARKEVAGGGDAGEATKLYAHLSVEADSDVERIASDLDLDLPAVWHPKHSKRFIAEVELVRFSRSVIGEMVAGVA
jgi:hypothetical protein